MAVRLTDIIAPSFYEVHRDVCAGQHTHYVLKGGRGSTKSSYISLEIVCGIIKNPDAHAIVFRKIADTLRDSVLHRCCGLSINWECRSILKRRSVR